jgi:hypothetical protein
MASQNRSVGLAADGTGKKVRNLEITVLEYDPVSGLSSPVTMQMQVISIADSTGRVLDFGNLEGAMDRLNDNIEELLFEIRLQNETQEE